MRDTSFRWTIPFLCWLVLASKVDRPRIDAALAKSLCRKKNKFFVNSAVSAAANSAV